MTALADAVLAVLPDLRCDCWFDNAADAVEYVVDVPCPKCRLREALRAEGVDPDAGAVTSAA